MWNFSAQLTRYQTSTVSAPTLRKPEEHAPDKYKKFMELHPEFTASRDEFYEASTFILPLLQAHTKSVADEDVDNAIISYFAFKAYHLGEESKGFENRNFVPCRLER
jgi:hypothetical protein